MGIIVFNFPGIIIVAAAFGTAYGLGELTGYNGTGPQTLIGGILTLTFDFAYRLAREERHWITPNKGGSLFFLPAWCLGALWVVLGTVYIVQGK
jgi:hypothetical protein